MVKTARPYVFLFPAILIMLTSASCASNNLTRGKARDVICAQAVFVFGMDQPASYTLYGAAIERGVKAGFFRWESSLSGQVLILTDNGKRLFAELGYKRPEMPVTVTPKQLTRRLFVEVTGITEAPALLTGGDTTPNTVKLVEFTWKWDVDRFPNELKSVLPRSELNSASAVLRLYDDGWRFQSIQEKE